MAGTTLNPYRFGGQLGYRTDLSARLYVRERHLNTSKGRWLSKDPIGTSGDGLNFYWYAKNNSVNNFDPTGLKTVHPNCDAVSKCLSEPRSSCSCGRKTHHTISQELLLCVFWQETGLGVTNHPPGGMGSCTADCFMELQRTGSCWINRKFKRYSDFVNSATPCEKAQAAADFMGCVGLIRYGPGRGRVGDYRGKTGQKVRDCEKCMQKPIQPCITPIFPTLPVLDWGMPEFTNQRCEKCFRLVHT